MKVLAQASVFVVVGLLYSFTMFYLAEGGWEIGMLYMLILGLMLLSIILHAMFYALQGDLTSDTLHALDYASIVLGLVTVLGTVGLEKEINMDRYNYIKQTMLDSRASYIERMGKFIERCNKMNLHATDSRSDCLAAESVIKVSRMDDDIEETHAKLIDLIKSNREIRCFVLWYLNCSKDEFSYSYTYNITTFLESGTDYKKSKELIDSPRKNDLDSMVAEWVDESVLNMLAMYIIGVALIMKLTETTVRHLKWFKPDHS